MGFGVAVLFVGVCVFGQPLDSAAFEAPPCITQNNTVLEVNYVIPAEMLKWAREGVDAHNKFRKKHGVPPLVLNPNMCKSTQWAADRSAVALGLNHTVEISGIGWEGFKCGEISDMSVGRILKPASHFVQKWYDDDIKNYDFDKHKEKPGKYANRFIQLVWKGSKEMCMTHAKSKRGRHYVVAHYFPMGYYLGAHAENVFNSANHDHFKTGFIFILILCVHLF